MPRSFDDDAPRWELPVWEPPAGSPSDDGPHWEPEREIPRWQPRRDPVIRPRAGVRPAPSPAPAGEAPPPRISPIARPLVWCGSHPWIVVWAFVFLAPATAVLLRALDESGQHGLVQPLAWTLGGLFVAALVVAMLASARRSVSRPALGALGALGALAAVLWPVTQITLGRTACPPRAGTDLGIAVAGAALDAWRRGAAADDVWRLARADDGWRERSRAGTLLQYQLVEAGCWERVAPIDATRTWHEFRVTVRDGARAPLSKSVVVHTAVGKDGWKITAIEGPLP